MTTIRLSAWIGLGPLADDDLRTLCELLARYAYNHLDQWEQWRVETTHGPVYIDRSVKLSEEASDDAYLTIWPLPVRVRPGE